VESAPKRLFFVRAVDLPAFEAAGTASRDCAAAFIAPLGNLTWDRELLRQVFDFDYCWEIYKPKEKRAYGYHVLPVLSGDRFVARRARLRQEGARPDDRRLVVGEGHSPERRDARRATSLRRRVRRLPRPAAADRPRHAKDDKGLATTPLLHCSVVSLAGGGRPCRQLGLAAVR